MEPEESLSYATGSHNILRPCLFKIHINIISLLEPSLDLPSGLLASDFPLISFMCVPHSAYHTLLHFITMMIFGEYYKL
jgi:hypothetical protein